jgi:hypothetical protein
MGNNSVQRHSRALGHHLFILEGNRTGRWFASYLFGLLRVFAAAKIGSWSAG